MIARSTVPSSALAMLCLLALTACCRGPAARLAPKAVQRTVVVISLDGFRHDYAARSGSAAPSFATMQRDGARALRLLPPFPSQTFASHATLATGVRPARHGIINNEFRDRKRGEYHHGDDVTWYDAVPLWIHVQRRGLRAHVYHWIASAGAWRGTEPAFFRRFSRSVTDREKVGAIIDWLKRPRRTRPSLVMSYMSGCDRPGHDHGPDSAEVARCVRKADQHVGRVLAAVRATRGATLLIVSDHGMTRTLGLVNPGLALERAGVKGARVIISGPVGHVYLSAAQQLAKARAVLGKLSNMRVALPSELPRYRHATRTGDLVLVAATGYRLTSKTKTLLSGPTGGGHHGHAPSHLDMSGVLYLAGAGVKRGARLERAHAVDVVPTVCRLLGIAAPRGVEGRVLTELLR